MTPGHAWIEALLRFAMALLFLVSATTKVMETSAIQAYMHSYGVPELLIWPAAAWEYAAGICFTIGFRLRLVAGFLAGWCILTALIFHTQFSDANQLMNFFKNVTMAGVFLLLATGGLAGASLDAVLASRRQTAR
jgi:putative oxidoreductase